MTGRKVSIIIPCYNSETHIGETLEQIKLLKRNLESSAYQVEFVMVNDGSADRTLEKLLAFKAELKEQVQIVDLTGNFGSYNALLAGCHYATGNCCIQLHDDLQDPPEHIPEMLKHWQNGYKLVIGQRVEREEPLLHQLFAKTYHKLMQYFALPHVPSGGYDLILFDRELCNHIVAINESNTNLVYLISWLQYPYVSIPIKRNKPKTPSRWSFVRKVKLVIDSFVSFSYSPIQFIMVLALLSVILFAGFTIQLIICGHDFLLYWLITFLGMLIMVSLSIMAAYLYHTLVAARKRPPFIVNKIY